MTCKDFEDVIHEVVIRREASATQQMEALDHASHCLCCAMRLDEETNLSKALQGLRETLCAHQAPACVEDALVRTFREKASQDAAHHNALRRLLRPRLGWSVAVAASFAAALTLLLLAPGLYRHSNGPSPQAAQSRSLQAAAPSSAKAVQPLAIGQAQPAREGRTQKLAREKPASEEATEFIPLATCDDPECLDEAVVVRMALSSDALLMLGIPADGDRASGPVLADVVLGSDGVPYGIRFVD